MLINETMMNIQFNFFMINKEELKLVDNGSELQEKLSKTMHEIRDYYDPEDPQFITVAEAFKQRFKEHKFKLNIKSEVEDCDFIQKWVSKQYLNQYHDYYV